MIRHAKLAAGAFLLIFGLVYADLCLRARGAYLEGEKYERWHGDPSLKRVHYQEIYEREKTRLDKELAGGGLDKVEYDQKLALEAFRRDEAVSESSLKYAYHWYKTAVELFSPPESRWVRMSRERMAETKALWRKELDAKGIPYEEYMLE